MRIKQTARKSTGPAYRSPDFAPRAGPSSGRRSMQGPPPRVLNDPVNNRLSNLLQTKRKSITPAPTDGDRAHGRGGKGVSSRGKHIEGVKIKPRAAPGELALKEIQKLQKGRELLIPRMSFHRVVRELTHNILAERGVVEDAGFRYQAAALEALQEASEAYLVQMFEDSLLCCIHAKRVTLFVNDMQLCRRLQRHRGFY